MAETIDAPRSLFRRPPRETLLLDLVERTGKGDQQAFASLYDETKSLVYSLSLRVLGNTEDAEEVTLDVYNQVWRIAKTFVSERSSVTAWILMLTRTRSLDRLRLRASRQRNVEPLVAAFDPPATGASPEEQSAVREQRQIVLDALSQLPAEQRAVLEMAYFQGLSQTELAEKLDQPLGTVKTRMRLGMMKLRDLLQQAEMMQGSRRD